MSTPESIDLSDACSTLSYTYKTEGVIGTPLIDCIVRSFIYSTPRFHVQRVKGVAQLAQSSKGRGVQSSRVVKAGGEDSRIGDNSLSKGVGVRTRL